MGSLGSAAARQRQLGSNQSILLAIDALDTINYFLGLATKRMTTVWERCLNGNRYDWGQGAAIGILLGVIMGVSR